jgi:hypothetical protein
VLADRREERRGGHETQVSRPKAGSSIEYRVKYEKRKRRSGVYKGHTARVLKDSLYVGILCT